MTPARNKSEQELHNEKLSSVNFGISYILGDSFGKMASSEVSSPLSNKSFQDIEAISGTDGNSPQPWDIFCSIFVHLESFCFYHLSAVCHFRTNWWEMVLCYQNCSDLL